MLFRSHVPISPASFRARAAYPARASSPRLVALGEAAEVFREAAGGHFVGATLPEDVGWLPSGDLFIAFPALDGFVPTPRWECLHNTGRHTAQLNPGFDMPQPPDCSCWRFFRLPTGGVPVAGTSAASA